MRLSKAMVRPPSTNFGEGLSTSGLGPPDVLAALEQHDHYCRALEACGARLVRLDADARHPDATFVEDTAVVTDRGAILTRPGAPSRVGEVDAVRAALAEFYPVLDEILPPGTVDGGDVCEAGELFLIGISERTDEHGALQLASILRRLGYRTSLVDIRGVPGLLHLKSGVAWLGERRLAAIDALSSRPPLDEFEIVRVVPSETYAANCVPFNDRLLVAGGFPVFEETVRSMGYDVVPLAMSEFRKMDGGLSCLSLRF